MSTRQLNWGWGTVSLTLVIALVLSMFPLPEAFERARPAFVALVLIFWALLYPQLVGVFTAWFAGLFLDILLGDLIGQNALILALIVALTHRLRLRLRASALIQQAFTIFILVGIGQMLSLWIDGAAGRSARIDIWFFLPSVTSAVCWLYFYRILRSFRSNTSMD